MQVIDFFCGCGGASEGFRQAGFNIILGLDCDQQAAATYQSNFPEAEFIQRDIRQVDLDEVVHLAKRDPERPLLFTACAPCQPFSSQNKFKDSNDERHTLLDETHTYIRELQPNYVVIENVPGMQNVKENKDGPFSRFLHFLDNLGYQHKHFIAKSENYGVPQKRKRLVLIASLHGAVGIPPATHGEELEPYPTVRQFIEGYPAIEHGTVHEKDPIHVTARMSELNIERIRNTPEGGDCRDWPDRLINPCHRNYSGHTDTYGRMSWDELAPTLTTKCNSYSNGRFGHPDVTQDRAISIREASRIQTFPRDYVFTGSIGSMARQVGNAVPCELARQFGLYISHHYQQMQGPRLNG